jgi:hypothetical protein
VAGFLKRTGQQSIRLRNSVLTYDERVPVASSESEYSTVV